MDNINMGDMQEALSEVNGSAMQVNTLTTPNEETKSVKDAKLAVKAEKSIIQQSQGTEDVLPQKKRAIPRTEYAENQTVGLDTQGTFISNCVYDFLAGKHRILNWNTVGVVAIRNEFQYTVVDVEFMNKNFHRNLSINDDFHITMATLNYNGVLMASQAEEKNEDAYEEDLPGEDEIVDEMFKRRKNSNIHFKPFNEWKDVKEWSYELKNGESAECLAAGSGWNAVLTNYNYLRIFSNNGVQKDLICQAHPIVTMAGYENFLAIVYHSGPAFNGYQPMRLKVFNMATRDNRVLFDSDCAVTPTSELKWFGFSEEG